MEEMISNKDTKWTKEQNTWFESALAIFDTETPERWSNVAALVPGKTELDVKKQYEKLKADINEIEAGLVPDDQAAGYLTASSSNLKLELVDDHKWPLKFSTFDHETRRKGHKGVPWTQEEHRRFLMGLQVHGKGDWRSISRNFVTTKTSTQVASHAQKYYARQHSSSSYNGKDHQKRRPSIHDMTIINDLLPNTINTNSLIKTTLINSCPFETSNMTKNGTGGNDNLNIRVHDSALHFQPTRYQLQNY